MLYKKILKQTIKRKHTSIFPCKEAMTWNKKQQGRNNYYKKEKEIKNMGQRDISRMCDAVKYKELDYDT